MMEPAPFVETSVSRVIFDTIDSARALHQNAAIIGRPGVGKTRALRAYYGEQAGAYFTTVTAITGNALRDLMRSVAESLTVYVSGSIADMQRQLMQYDFSGRVLIIDEAQNLKLQAFRELLNLWDFAGLSIIFAGNEEVLRRVRTDKGAFAQISRRVKFRVTLNSIEDRDVDMLASAFGVEGTDAHKMLRAIGRNFEIDGVVTVLQVARRSGGGKAITTKEIRSACGVLPQYGSALK